MKRLGILLIASLLLFFTADTLESGVLRGGAAGVSDEAYDAGTWDGVTNVAPSKNAIRDELESIGGSAVEDDVYGAGWDGDTSHAPSQNAVYDKIETLQDALTNPVTSDGATTTENQIPQFTSTNNQLKDSLGLVTTVGDPGSDTNVPTEQAVRELVVGSWELVDDPSPQLGANLDVNGKEIQSTGDIILQLGDSDGTYKLILQDSGSAVIWSIDSDGGQYALPINNPYWYLNENDGIDMWGRVYDTTVDQYEISTSGTPGSGVLWKILLEGANIGDATLDGHMNITSGHVYKINGTQIDLADLSDGLSHAGGHITGQTDEIDGDKLDIDWNPSTYTPATTPSEVDNVDNLTAHLYGIDQYLAGIASGTFAGLTDTNISTPSSGQIAIYDGADSWDNKTVGGDATLANDGTLTIGNDKIDSQHYVAGSIDAEHLAADIIDESKIADDGIDSEHYNDSSIDAVHVASVLKIEGFTISLGNDSDAITTGTKILKTVRVPFKHDLSKIRLTTDETSGSITVDVWVDEAGATNGLAAVTDADSLFDTASEPAIADASSDNDVEVTSFDSGEATDIPAGSYYVINVDSASTLTYVAVSFQMTRKD